MRSVGFNIAVLRGLNADEVDISLMTVSRWSVYVEHNDGYGVAATNVAPVGMGAQGGNLVFTAQLPANIDDYVRVRVSASGVNSSEIESGLLAGTGIAVIKIDNGSNPPTGTGSGSVTVDGTLVPPEQ